MRRRAYIAGAMTALTMALGTTTTVPRFCKLAATTHNFRQYFRDLGKSGVSGIERVVFSLVLANSKTPKPESGS